MTEQSSRATRLEETIGELAVKLVVTQTRKARLHRELNDANAEETAIKRDLSKARREYGQLLGEELDDA